MNNVQKRVLIYSLLVVILAGAFFKSPYYKPEKISKFYVRMGFWETDYLQMFDLARFHYHIALLFNPKSSWAYNAMGDSYYNQGLYHEKFSEEMARQDYEKAISNFTKAIELVPHYTSAYTNRGDCYRFLGDYDEAMKNYKIALKYDSKSKRGLYGLSLVYDYQKKYDEDIKVLNKLVEFYPEYEDAYFGLGWTYSHLGDYKTSVKYYEKVVDLNSNRVDAWINLSNVSVGLRDYEKAIYYADKALDLNRSSLYALNNKTDALIQLKRYDEAMEYIELQLYQNKNYSRTYIQRGQVRLAQNDKSGAKQDFEKALELEEGSNFEDNKEIIGMIKNFLKQCE